MTPAHPTRPVAGRTVALVLPWPPSVNRIWRAILGRVVLSEAARHYGIKLANALPAGPVDPLRGRLRVVMTLHAPLAQADRAYDIANREKHVFDCLTKQRIWIDDSQIDELIIMRGPPQGEGFAMLDIVEIA